MKKVLVGGVFDVLHPGHEFFLQKAKEYGDYLIVVVASDKTVKQKREHFNTQEKRIQNMERFGFVDKVVAGKEVNFFEVVDESKPDIVVFGHDQDRIRGKLEAGLKEREIEIVQLKDAWEREVHSTSKLLEMR